MNFAGTITESNGMTMTRLIERIVHSDTPGELRLQDESSGRRATVAIRRGMVREVSFGDLTGDPALTAISQVMPWTFEFFADEAGARPAHPSMVSRGPRARTVLKAAPRPSPPPEVAAEPVEQQTILEAAPEPPAPEPEPVSEPEPPATAVPALTGNHHFWLATSGVSHCIRFGTAGNEFAGQVHEDDHDFFRSDYEFLRGTAAAIARSIGWDPPRVFAIAEAERATGYCPITGGFLGIMGGAGSGVEHVLDFPGGGTAMNEALKNLSDLDGVSGLCVHRGGIIKWQRLPDSLSNDRAAALCSSITRAFAAYATVERPLTQAWFEFGTQNILVIARPPELPGMAPDTFVTLLLYHRHALPEAARMATEFLNSAEV